MKNRAFLISVFIIITSFKAFANPVDSTRALNYAIEFFKSKSAVSSQARFSTFEIDLVKKEPYLVTSNSTKARIQGIQDEYLYYVFNVKNNGGFIIISGDDAATPVLAYGLEGDFESSFESPAANMYLSWYKGQLERIKNKKLPSTKENSLLWDLKGSIHTKSRLVAINSVSPLIQTKWGQGSEGKTGAGIYNALCPDVSNSHVTKKSIVGCTAVAMAQILKKIGFNGILNGNGTYSKYIGYDSKNEPILSPTIEVSINNVNLNTQILPDIITQNSSNAIKAEIAKLMYYSGISANMEYMISSDPVPILSSGAGILEAKKGLIDLFGLDKGMKLVPLKTTVPFSNAQIEQLKDELISGRPILFRGAYDSYIDNQGNEVSGSAHMFVMDGFDENGKFHFNFGWNGSKQDNYFEINRINPYDAATENPEEGGGKGLYNLRQQALINLKLNSGCQPPGYKVSNVSINPKFWYQRYVQFAANKGVVEVENNNFNANKIITKKSAAKSIFLTAQYLGYPGFTQNVLTCNNNDPDLPYILFLRNNGYITADEALSPSSNITLGLLSKMIDNVLVTNYITKFPVFSERQLSRISSNAEYRINITNVLSIKSLLPSNVGNRYKTERPFSGLSGVNPILGAETVKNHLLSKILASIISSFEAINNKNVKDGKVLPTSDEPFVGSNNPMDYIELGDKFETEAGISGTEIPSITSPTLTLNGGEIRSFTSANLTHDGLPLHFYWTVDGGTIEKMTDNFSKIKFTAPYVTSQKKIQLYFYTASSGGYALEAFRTIIVNPINVNFSISSTASNICSGEPITLTASGCSGTLQWNENLGYQANLTIRPTSSKTYFADCLYSGTSKRSNSISVTVKPAPTTSPIINNGYSTVFSGDRVTLIASGCPSGTTYYWKDFLASDRVTFYPTESDSYTAYCVKDGCNSLGTTTEVNVINTNCDIGEVNNTPGTAHTLFEFKDKIYGGSEYYGEGRFCIKNPTDNVDWFKFKIHNKWYYLKIGINENSCPDCIYKLRFQVDGGRLLVMSYLFTPGETANVQVYDSNQTTLLGSQNFNNSTEHELEINICGSLPVPLIDYAQNQPIDRCGSGAFTLSATHPIYVLGIASGQGTDLSFSWSENQDGSNQLDDGPYFWTGLINSSKTYYVRTMLRNTPGCLGSQSLAFTVNTNVNPSVVPPTVSVNKTNIVLGESITLTATGCPGAIEWSLPILIDDNISSEVKYGEEIIYKPVLGSFDNQITNIYYARCMTQTCIGTSGGSPSVTVRRVNKPIIASNKTNICSGEIVELSATGCTNGIITWNNNLGTGTSKTANPTIPTTYSATCTLSGATTDFADGVTVFVNNFVSGTITPATQTICQDASAGVSRLLNQQFVLSDYTGQILRWEYKTPTSDWNDWGQAGVESPSNCCFGWQTGTWKVRALIGNGVCTSTYSPEASVEVLPLPSASIYGTQTITAGQSANLSVNLTGNAPWTIVLNGTTYTANTSPFTISVSPSTTTTYTLSSVSNSCGAGVVSGSAVVTVNPSCILSTASMTGTQTINLGQTANMSISLTGTAPWTFRVSGITFNSNTSPFTFSSTPGTIGTRSFTITEVRNTCGLGSIIGSGTATITVVGQSITYSSPTNTSYSTGQTIPITYNSTGGTGLINLELVSCTGTTSLGAISTSSAASGTVNYAIPGSLFDGSYRIKAYTSSYPANVYYSPCFNYYACGTLPDIIISDVAITKYAANRVNYAITVKNTSISPASLGSVSLGVFASPDALKNSNDIFKSSIFAGGGTLQPGQTFVINDFSSFNFADPNYFLAFSIDHHSLLSECNESNNNFVKLVNACSWPNNSQSISWSGRFTQPFYAANFPIKIPSFISSIHPNVLFVAPSLTIPPVFNSQTFTAIPGGCFDSGTYITNSIITENSAKLKLSATKFEDVSYFNRINEYLELHNKPQGTKKVSLVDANTGQVLLSVNSIQKSINGGNLQKGSKYFIVFETHEGIVSEGFEW